MRLVPYIVVVHVKLLLLNTIYHSLPKYIMGGYIHPFQTLASQPHPVFQASAYSPQYFLPSPSPLSKTLHLPLYIDIYLQGRHIINVDYLPVG